MECFNENCYLNINNEDAIKYLYGLRDKYSKKIRESAMKYGNNIQSYNEYLDRIAYLVKSMSLSKNAISASLVLHMLTKSGLFSDNHSFIVGGFIPDDIKGFLGINVIRGNAVCRHVTNFQSDVLEKINMMSDPFYCYLSKIELEEPNKMECNHAINLILYKDNLYGYDALNNGLYQFISDNTMKEMFTNKPHYIYYKPYMDIVLENTSISGANNLIDIFDKIKEKDVISLDEYNYILYWANSMITKNSKLLDEFHESSKKYIRKITNHLN